MKHTVYDSPTPNPPTPNPSPKESNLLKYWPVAAAFFIIVIISVLLIQGTRKSKDKSENDNDKIENNVGNSSQSHEDNKPNEQENLVESPIDSDKDGVFDDQDECPNKKVLKQIKVVLMLITIVMAHPMEMMIVNTNMVLNRTMDALLRKLKNIEQNVLIVIK